MKLTLNVLLGKLETASSRMRKLVADYQSFFKNKQGEFQGVRKTYDPRPGTQDDTSMRQFKQVVTTVTEKLDYLVDHNAPIINDLLTVEATNASGVARTDLVINGISFGNLSTLELMKLKSILEKEGFEAMYASLPVRSDSEIWNVSEGELYANRSVFETEMQKGIQKSLVKSERILEDPNIKNMVDTSRYTPVKTVDTTVVELGDYTVQHFSGETTHRNRAYILKRRSDAMEALNAALKAANDVEVVKSEFDTEKFLKWLHLGYS